MDINHDIFFLNCHNLVYAIMIINCISHILNLTAENSSFPFMWLVCWIHCQITMLQKRQSTPWLALKQESPAIADKTEWRENMPKIALIQRAYNVSLTILVYLHSFSCWLHPKSAKNREILRKFKLIEFKVILRSSILVSIESAYATSYQSLIVTFAVSATVFVILMLKARKWLNFPTPPLFEASAWRNPLEWRDEICHQKTRIVGLLDGEEIMTLAFFVLTQYRRVTDRQTDRQAHYALSKTSHR